MDRNVLATRLVEIASDLANLKNASVATGSNHIVTAMAESVIAFDMDTEVTTLKAQIGALAKVYKESAAKLIAEKKAADAIAKEKDKILTAYTKNWKKESGYDKIRDELLAQADQCLKVGDVLDDLDSEITVAKRLSKQPAYEVAWSIVVSTLNDAELKKYVVRLEEAFKKVFVELKTGVKDLDDVVKDWQDSAKEIAKERGIELQTASITAGMLDGFMDSIKSVIPQLMLGIRNWGANLWRAISGQTAQIDSITDSLMVKVNKARAILAE